MEGIFFAVTEIWWNTPVAIWSILIALIWGVCIVVSMEYKRQKKIQKIKKNTQEYIFKLVDPTDPKYAEQTLINIRQYLARQYHPMHSWAHIPLDIRTYTTDTELITIIEQLEQIEFSGKNTEPYLKESINTELLRKL